MRVLSRVVPELRFAFNIIRESLFHMNETSEISTETGRIVRRWKEEKK